MAYLLKRPNTTVYYKEYYDYYNTVTVNYVRPNLSSNGTMGVSDFAVQSNNYPWNDTSLCYLMFDGATGQQVSSTMHTGGAWIKMYFKEPIKITGFKFFDGYVGNWYGMRVLGSNNGTNWTTIYETTATINSGGGTQYNFANNNQYNYYQLYCINGHTHDGCGYGGGFSEIQIIATKTTTTKVATNVRSYDGAYTSKVFKYKEVATEEDYDTSEQIENDYVLRRQEHIYVLKENTRWQT